MGGVAGYERKAYLSAAIFLMNAVRCSSRESPTFSAWRDQEIIPAHRLARLRQLGHRNHKIRIRAADDQYLAHK